LALSDDSKDLRTNLSRQRVVGFQVLRAMSTKMAVLWVVAPSRLCEFTSVE
jgi:hypothetical protein